MKKTIAIQGILGSFHHQATEQYFNEQEFHLDQCLSFPELAKSLKNGKSELAVMALENSIAGAIIPNYTLIDQNNFHIIGEYYLVVNHNLMAAEGQSIEDIKEVHSHPMAILQCRDFFDKYPHIKLIESADTAETAQKIQRENLKGIGAIAGIKAAEMFDLDILASEIHSIKNNQTRFVILKQQNEELSKEEIDKVSLKFVLDDTPGSLATLLNVMSNCKLNLTKIQSMPVIETPFKYSFFVDVIFDKYKHFEKAKKIIELMTTEFKILGEYKNGIK